MKKCQIVKCPNYSQKTSGDYCRWCGYPILRSRPIKRRRMDRQAKIEAEQAAKEAKKQATSAERLGRDFMITEKRNPNFTGK